MSDWYHSYYEQSRACNWHDLMEMRSQPRDVITEIPDVFKDKFETVDDYIEWLEQKRKDYFG